VVCPSQHQPLPAKTLQKVKTDYGSQEQTESYKHLFVGHRNLIKNVSQTAVIYIALQLHDTCVTAQKIVFASQVRGAERGDILISMRYFEGNSQLFVKVKECKGLQPSPGKVSCSKYIVLLLFSFFFHYYYSFWDERINK